MKKTISRLKRDTTRCRYHLQFYYRSLAQWQTVGEFERAEECFRSLVSVQRHAGRRRWRALEVRTRVI